MVSHDGRLYAEAWTFKILDPATGTMLGDYIDHNGTDYSQPVFAGTLGIFHTATGLLAAGPDGAARWAFTGEVRRPVTAGGHAYTVLGGLGIDDPAGLVALDLASGAPVWCADLAVRPYPDGTVGQITSGNGLIVVRWTIVWSRSAAAAAGPAAAAPPVSPPLRPCRRPPWGPADRHAAPPSRSPALPAPVPG